jgi:translation initiation factor 2 subunit 3
MAPRKKAAKADEEAAPASAQPEAGSSGVSQQPEVSIGMVGHVDHGKTTLVQALSGKWTDTHSEELKRGITIKLGYADIDIYKDESKEAPECWTLAKEVDGKPTILTRKVSIVDAPGHESLMATMLSGANIMDGAILLVAANEECPQPQTREHVQALAIMGIKNVVVVQNKIDLVTPEQAQKNHEQIIAFLKGTSFENAPIIPISARYKVNIDVLLDAVQTTIPTPERDANKDPLFFVARSFDINKPGTTPEKMKGGVLGGAVKQGIFQKGVQVEMLPGYEVEERNQKVWKPLTTTIVSMMAGSAAIEVAKPGGSVGMMTQLDPSIVKSDKLVGSVVGLPGKLPPVWSTIKLEPHLLERVVGAKDDLLVKEIFKTETLMLNVNSAATVGVVSETGRGHIKLTLRRPVCAAVGSRVTISRNVEKRWRLIGYGTIVG